MDLFILAAALAAFNSDDITETCNYFLQAFQEKTKTGTMHKPLRRQGRADIAAPIRHERGQAGKPRIGRTSAAAHYQHLYH